MGERRDDPNMSKGLESLVMALLDKPGDDKDQMTLMVNYITSLV